MHGWSVSGGTSCASTFDPMIADLRADGFTGPMVRVGFSTGDTGCDVNLRSFGDVGKGPSWKAVAQALSHYVHDTYTVHGIPVDVVGHSMGGTIARGAVQGTAGAQPGFSAPILVEDVVTFGAPFDGAASYSNICLCGQCSTLKPGAADIRRLDEVGDPQDLGGTEWTIFGSTTDDVVPASWATDMTIAPERIVVSSDVEHSDHMRRADDVARAAEALAGPKA